MISAYPLQWPEGWKRSFMRIDGKFSKKDRYSGSIPRSRDLTVSDGVERVLRELERFGVSRDDIVISTNVRTRLDGLPRSGEKEPSDPGAAVYWVDANTNANRVMAIDQYTTVADNLAAIAATLDAMRAIERHGGAQILERAFTGFTALPAPGAKKPWREVMDYGNSTPGLEALKGRYRVLANLRHPDKPGGSHDAMVELNEAYEQAQQEIGV